MRDNFFDIKYLEYKNLYTQPRILGARVLGPDSWFLRPKSYVPGTWDSKSWVPIPWVRVLGPHFRQCLIISYMILETSIKRTQV